MNSVILQGFRDQVNRADEVAAFVGNPDEAFWEKHSPRQESDAVCRTPDADLSEEEAHLRQLTLTRAGLSYLSAIAHLLLDQAERAATGKDGGS